MRHAPSLYQHFSYTTNIREILTGTIVKDAEKKTKPLLLGIELECSSDLTINEMMDAQDTPFFLCKSDSSISGSKRNRYEMVTVPMSAAAQKEHWAKWFENIDLNKFDTSLDTNNGLHIHIDRLAFKEAEESDISSLSRGSS